MSQNVQAIIDLVKTSAQLSELEKATILGTLTAFEKEQNSAAMKLEQAEKAKRPTAILLEEALAELEQQRKVVEEKARELEIEAALERVRIIAMGMKKPADMLDVCEAISHQLDWLHVKEIRNVQTAIFYEDRQTYMNYEYYAKHDKSFITETTYTNNQIHHAFANQMLKGSGEFFTTHIKGDSVKDWIAYQKTTNVFIDDYLNTASSLNYYWHSLGEVALGISTYEPLTEEDLGLFNRFLKVFELAYRRYLDIEKAEAQAREARIETALERVRSRTMAMHKTSELQDVIHTLHKELLKLNVSVDGGSFVVINSDVEPAFRCWGSGGTADTSEEIHVPHFNMPFLKNLIKGVRSGPGFFTEEFSQQEKIVYFTKLFEHKPWSDLSDEQKKETLSSPGGYTRSVAVSNHTSIFIINHQGRKFTEGENDILKRFAKVFEQTYTRFLDLQKAEAQAREATIEAALEKVRGKAMAMHDSSDLSATASLVFTELRRLGITPIRCGVGLLNKESRKTQLYSATSSASSDHLSLVGWVQLEGHPVLETIYESWLQQKDYFPELQGEQLRRYYELLLAGLSVPVPDFTGEQKQYGHFVSFSIGCLYAWSDVQYNNDQLAILKRFAAIVDLTFRRYLELQRSEINAKEAMKQAALDRIRADIASMRTVGDLDRIIPLIWNELTNLGISFIRCGVFIMDDVQELIHTFLSTPEGKAIAAFHLPYDTPGNFSQIVQSWRNKKNYIDHWNESDFSSLAAILVQQGAVSTKEQYLNALPQGGFYLHFVPFQQGMLYVGNTTELVAEDIQLLEVVADAFSTAYARYEDFNRLEVAKQQVEFTLAELKTTQAQLIQKEKMASLGELTAGIAHEIQNPLNFMNNFSEVNKELIEELHAEAEKGNVQEVLAIAADIKANEEKVSHHGKRADNIVKGMLQHARASTGEKYPTDINQLVDEYLRLSFQGMRAKDKAFTAAVETNFFKSEGTLDVVPQDIGRVLLNLFNNAFYAVSEKKKRGNGTYQPTVTVITKRESECVAIRVKDNGTGMTAEVMNKIFQPFFTTKPTGEGTGLGLSLSYDIITKGHGGTLSVQSAEEQGSEFVVTLPVKKT